MVGGGLAAAVVVALRIPTNPRHSCGLRVHGDGPAPKVRSFKARRQLSGLARNGQWVASDASGQPTAAPLSGAPDTVGRRQEYTAGMKQIAADLARLRSTDNLDASLDQFDTANSQVSTGPQQPRRQPQPVNLLANMDQNYNDMQAAAGRRPQVGSVPQGQGAVSDFERRLYAMGSPNLPTWGRPTAPSSRTCGQPGLKRPIASPSCSNTSPRTALNGADAQWRSCIATNPYTRRRPIQGGGTQLFMNDGRTPWAQYFAVGGGRAGRRSGGNSDPDRPAEPITRRAARRHASNGPPGHAGRILSPPLAPR